MPEYPVNPPIAPQNAPSYMGLSKPISNVEADKSLAIGISGFGNALEAAVGAADFLVKDDIKNQAYAGVDKAREDFTGKLEEIKNSVTAPQQPVSPQGPTPFNILSPEFISNSPQVGQQELPGPLSLLPKTAGSIQNAMLGGTIPHTYYIQQLNNLTKDLRSQFPGYREFIDNTMKHITGMDPANAKMEDLLKELNQYGTLARTEHEKVQGLLDKAMSDNDIQDKRSVFLFNQGFATGNLTPLQVRAGLSALYAEKAKFQAEKDNFESMERNRTVAANQATDHMNRWLFSQTATFFKSVNAAQGVPTMEALDQKIREHINNPLPGPEYEQMAVQVLANRQAAFRQAWTYATQPGPNGEPSILDRMGGDGNKLTTLINNQLEPTYGAIYKALKDKDGGLAHYYSSVAQGILDYSHARSLNDPDMGPVFRAMETAKKFGGDPVSLWVTQQYLTAGLPEKIKPWIGRITADAIGQGTPTTLKGVLSEIKAWNEKNPQAKVDEAEVPKYFYSLITRGLTDPKLPDAAKVQLIKYGFDPSNTGSIQLIQPDKYDPQRGRYIPGQYVAFSDMTSPGVTKEIYRLSQQPGNGQLWTNYKNWTQETFGFQLYSRDLKDFNELQTSGAYGRRGSAAHFSFNTETSRLDVVDAAGKPVALPRGTKAQHTLDNLNLGLSSIRNIAIAEGKDPSTEIYRILKEAGTDPYNGPKEQSSKKFGEQINAAISNAVQSVKKGFKRQIIDAPMIYQYSDETNPKNYADLGSWLQNPSGQEPGPTPRTNFRPVPGISGGGTISHIQEENIPEGMTAREFLRQLKAQEQKLRPGER